MRRSSDWFRQARAALGQARLSLDHGYYWASCFFSQQAAEYAAKGLLASLGREARGHSIYELLLEARRESIALEEEMLRGARELDRHYLHSRYPNVYHVGAPLDYYDKMDAERAIEEAERIVRLCEEKAEAG